MKRLCQRLEAIDRGEDASPPSLILTNATGRYHFRAYWLEAMPAMPRLIGLHIEHQEPMQLTMLRNLHQLPLSPTQTEVAALLARGLSPGTICKRLGIRRSTLKAHIDNIYLKLDIHSRDALIERLIMPAPGF